MRLSRLATALPRYRSRSSLVVLLYGPLAVAIFFSFFRLERNAVAMGQLLVRRLRHAVRQSKPFSMH